MTPLPPRLLESPRSRTWRTSLKQFTWKSLLKRRRTLRRSTRPVRPMALRKPQQYSEPQGFALVAWAWYQVAFGTRYTMPSIASAYLSAPTVEISVLIQNLKLVFQSSTFPDNAWFTDIVQQVGNDQAVLQGALRLLSLYTTKNPAHVGEGIGMGALYLEDMKYVFLAALREARSVLDLGDLATPLEEKEVKRVGKILREGLLTRPLALAECKKDRASAKISDDVAYVSSVRLVKPSLHVEIFLPELDPLWPPGL